MANAPKKTCFVIAPIGSKDSDIRKRSDKVLKHIFRKALANGFEVTRGDEIDEPGMISSQVLRRVQESDLVVADLTTHNPNVMYELAVRHAMEKAVIHLIEPKLSKIPFDIAGFRTIEFDLTDPDSIESAVEQLKNHAEQAMSGKFGETPIKLANLMHRSGGDSPEMLLLKQAVEGIAEISSRLSTLEGTSSWSVFGNYAPVSGNLVPMSSLGTTRGTIYQGLDEAVLARTMESLYGMQPPPEVQPVKEAKGSLRDGAHRVEEKKPK
jgi:hypothetical protein